jgi:hypothetical protein
MQQQAPGSTGGNSVDYGAVDLPDKPRTDWHYTHRRAELLQLIREAGHPDDLNQTELAERYGVCQQQISKDLDRIGEAVRDRIASPGRHILMVESTINRSIRGLLNDGDYRDAAKTALEYDEWIQERIEAEGFRDRLDRLESAVGGGGSDG